MADNPHQDDKKPVKRSKTGATKKKVAKKTTARKTSASKSEQNSPEPGRRAEDRIMPGLLQNLEGVFDKIYKDNREQDKTRDLLAKDMGEHVQQSFKAMHEQLEEREQILDRKLSSIDRLHSHQLQRVKWMSVPVMIFSLVAVVYLFYVVRVMEVAMSSMSENMAQMTGYMQTITTDTHDLSKNTEEMVSKVHEMNTEISAMNTSFTQMNTNVNNLMVDVRHMSRTVSPAMQGISRFMP
ncbi:MAG: hypothetical protein V3W04_01415 [Gammaproteobacteria bacterium]